MKASPFSLRISAILLLGISLPIWAQSGQYTVQIDSMTAQDAAEGKVRQLKSQGQNAYWLKSTVPGQGLRYRVRIGRFPTRVAAQAFGARLKQQGVASDFYVALFEGTSSPLGSNETVKKPEPTPAPTNTAKTVPAEIKTTGNKAAVLPVATKPTPVENKVVETKSVENKTPAVPAPQRQREVKTPAASVNSVSEKPVLNAPSAESTIKSVTPQKATPITPPPTQNAAPKPAPVVPTETKPLQSKPLVPTPLDENKPPRDKKASNEPLPAPTTNATKAAATAAAVNIEPAADPAATKTTLEVAKPTAANNGFQRFEERTYGYSFEHPGYWNGGRLNPEELQAQRIDAGAVFRSQEDVAFMNAIWNSLKNANSPAYDNNLIVDLVIKSLSSGTGLQGLNETSRRVVQEGDQIKTFVDLRTLFRQPRANQSLEFQGKAVIIRANTGILLVVTFYSKDSTPSMIEAADRIIRSARVP